MISTEPGAAIRVDGLAVHLPDTRRWITTSREVLHDLAFEVPRGQVTVLVGSNGAGKTTLLRTLAGAYAPSRGSVDVLGTAMGGPEQVLPAGVGVVPDTPHQPDHWTADDLVRVQRLTAPAHDARRVGRWLRRAGIDPGQQLRQLSAGQRTRLLLAVVLGGDPELLLLDEPFARLDPLARDDVMDTLREHLAGGVDRTLLLSTHDLSEVEHVADHLVLLHDGEVVLEGDALDLVEEHMVATCDRDAVGARSSARPRGDVVELLVRAEDAVELPGLRDLHRPTLQDLLTFTLREVTR